MNGRKRKSPQWKRKELYREKKTIEIKTRREVRRAERKKRKKEVKPRVDSSCFSSFFFLFTLILCHPCIPHLDFLLQACPTPIYTYGTLRPAASKYFISTIALHSLSVSGLTTFPWSVSKAIPPSFPPTA